MVMDRRARGRQRQDIWGFVFQGNAYEGLTCNALEWVKSNGGGQIVEPDGTISINNPQAAEAHRDGEGLGRHHLAATACSPTRKRKPRRLAAGNAVFMRNWPYAYALGNGDDCADQGQVRRGAAAVGRRRQRSAATLGGWNLAVSKYSPNPDAAIELVKFLASTEMQKERALEPRKLPTIQALYDDAEIAAEQPIIPRWKEVFLNAVPRPSAPTKVKYNEVSNEVLDAPCTTRCPAAAPPPTTSSCSRPT